MPNAAVSTVEAATSVRSSSDFDPVMRTLIIGDLDTLGQGAQVASAIVAIIEPYPFTAFWANPLSMSGLTP